MNHVAVIASLEETNRKTDSLWLEPGSGTVKVPSSRWGTEFLDVLRLAGDSSAVPDVVEVHWENIRPWLTVARSGTLHTRSQIPDLAGAMATGADIPPVVRSWRGDSGDDAVSSEEEKGDYPYFRDGKHRVTAAAALGMAMVPVISVSQWDDGVV